MALPDLPKLQELMTTGKCLQELERIAGTSLRMTREKPLSSCGVLTEAGIAEHWEDLSDLFLRTLFASASWTDPGLERVFNCLMGVESRTVRADYPQPLTQFFIELVSSKPSTFVSLKYPMDESEWNQMFLSFWNMSMAHVCMSERTFSTWPAGKGKRHDSPRTGICAVAWSLLDELDKLPAWKVSSVYGIYKSALQTGPEGNLQLLKHLTDYLRSGGCTRRSGQGRQFVKELWDLAIDGWETWEMKWTATCLGRMLAVPILQSWALDDVWRDLNRLGKVMQDRRTWAGNPYRVYDFLLDTLNSERVSIQPNLLSLHVVRVILRAYCRGNGEQFFLDEKMLRFVDRCLHYAYTQPLLAPQIESLFEIFAEKTRRGTSPKRLYYDVIPILVDVTQEQSFHTAAFVTALSAGLCKYMVNEDGVLTQEGWVVGPLQFYQSTLYSLHFLRVNDQYQATLESLSPFLSAPFRRASGPGPAAALFGEFWRGRLALLPDFDHKIETLKPALQYYMPKCVNAFDLPRDTITEHIDNHLQEDETGH